MRDRRPGATSSSSGTGAVSVERAAGPLPASTGRRHRSRTAASAARSRSGQQVARVGERPRARQQVAHLRGLVDQRAGLGPVRDAGARPAPPPGYGSEVRAGTRIAMSPGQAGRHSRRRASQTASPRRAPAGSTAATSAASRSRSTEPAPAAGRCARCAEHGHRRQPGDRRVGRRAGAASSGWYAGCAPSTGWISSPKTALTQSRTGATVRKFVVERDRARRACSCAAR